METEMQQTEMFGMEGESPERQPQMAREEQPISEARKRLVETWCKEVKADKDHWKDAFKAMKEDQDFAFGLQWSSRSEDDRYVANITLRHIQQRVAALYAKNPKVVARRRERLMMNTWDGSMSHIMLSMQQMEQGMMNPQAAQQGMAVLQEAQQVRETRQMLDRFSRTLELLYEYNVDEQAHNFKTMMKLSVRRAVTCGVGYVKLGFQRVLEPRPEIEARIADVTQKLATLERLSKDMADGEIPEGTDAPEAEQLRLMLQHLQEEKDAVVREGLTFDYPDSTKVIPDRKTKQLREFLGADRVTQEYLLSPDEVKEIYGVDVKMAGGFKHYNEDGSCEEGDSPYSSEGENGEDEKKALCCVWESYCRVDGLVYVMCDGYPDFLQEPAAPEVYTERFWPWYPVVFNECDHPKQIFPPSDVRLIRDQQQELNRLRQALREHRIANRPKVAVAGGLLSEDDIEALKTHPANAVIEFDGLSPGQSIDQLIQAVKMPGIDPNLYEVNGVFEDVLRTVGVQEANLGAVSGGTATESSIAESSRMSSLASNIDDLDDLLTELARNGGQILMAEMTPDMVRETVGPGAVWPEMSREDIAREVFLEIEAGSTGRPNQAQEIQNYERLTPILSTIPGVSAEWLAKEGIRRLDDKIDLSEAYDANLLSIQALNAQAQAQARPGANTSPQQSQGPNAPTQQGQEGAQNAEQAGRVAGAPGGPDMPGPSGPLQ